MPKLISWGTDRADWLEDPYADVADDESLPQGDVIVSLTRFQADGEWLLAAGRQVGVRIAAGEAVEALAYDLPRIAVVALEFPKFRDGRAYSGARILRQRLGYDGEIRAVGDVLVDQARFMVRCGFNTFCPADGTGPEDWTRAVRQFRHVYQRAADGLEPAFAKRSAEVVHGL